MKNFTFISYSAKETINFAKKLSHLLKKGDIIGFFGNLGSGKTTFIKGLADGLGFKKAVNSPSFVILKIYPIKLEYFRKKDSHRMFLYHFDLYRLKNLRELEDVGYEDFVSDSGICVIEWADRAKDLLPKEYLKVNINVAGESIRKINLIGHGRRFVVLVSQIKKYLGGNR